MLFFDVSAILTLLKIMNVDYETLMQLRRVTGMQPSGHSREVKSHRKYTEVNLREKVFVSEPQV